MRATQQVPTTVKTAPVQRNSQPEELKELYLSTVRLLERLHRQFLELVEVELDRLKVEDINNVQSLILFHIGDDNLTVGELLTRGYYLGSNVSYNVRKLVETGYLVQERSVHDRRSSRVFLSEKGLTLFRQLNEMFDEQVSALKDIASPKDLDTATATFKRLGGFWHNLGGIGGRSTF
jgi:DNA-binding MarR family transcriptional regulator